MKLSIRIQLLAYTVVTMLFVATALTFFTVQTYEKRSLDVYLHEAKGIISALGESNLNHLYYMDVRNLRESLRSLFSNPNVRFGMFFDKDGTYITNGHRETPPDAQALERPLYQALFNSKEILDEHDEHTLYVSSPVEFPGEGIVGYIYLGISLDVLKERRQEKLFDSLFISLICVFLGSIIAYFLATSFTKPIRELTESAERVSLGKEIKINPSNTREIQKLSDSLSSMLLKLNARDKELTLLNRKLEGKVRERTKELRKALKDATQASQAKSNFLASMSHELRTPLNAIIGYSEMLFEGGSTLSDEELKKDILHIHTAGVHLLGLVNDVLDISKLEAGKMEVHMEHFSIDDLIQDIQGTINPMVKKNNNTVHIKKPQNLGEMESDLTKVRQSLLNLLSNACKFTKDGSITLKCSLSRQKEPESVFFEVQDTGCGIPKDKIPILFEQFTQADSSTTKQYGGTGLGLAITKRFCEVLGGEITLASVEGKGTTFTISFPLRAQPKNSEKKAPEDKNLVA